MLGDKGGVLEHGVHRSREQFQHGITYGWVGHLAEGDLLEGAASEVSVGAEDELGQNGGRSGLERGAGSMWTKAPGFLGRRR
jgi:hypothetical protein